MDPGGRIQGGPCCTPVALQMLASVRPGVEHLPVETTVVFAWLSKHKRLASVMDGVIDRCEYDDDLGAKRGGGVVSLVLGRMEG
jgi:hypothetical protein